MSKAKVENLVAKRHVKHVVWEAKAQASKETFKPTDSQRSSIFQIAEQMDCKNQGIVPQICVLQYW